MIRLKRVSEFADWLRAYTILIDGAEVGTIKTVKEVALEVAHGRHTLSLKIDWCRSNTLEFMSDGEPLEFECGSNFPGFRSFLGVAHAMASGGDYLWLRERDKPSPDE